MMNTELSYAANHGDIASLQRQLDEERDACGSVGPTTLQLALMWAAAANQVEAVRYLLSRGAKAGSPTVGRGHYPLIEAAQGGAREAVIELLQAGADATQVDRWGRSAVERARLYRHPELAELIQAHIDGRPMPGE